MRCIHDIIPYVGYKNTLALLLKVRCYLDSNCKKQRKFKIIVYLLSFDRKFLAFHCNK